LGVRQFYKSLVTAEFRARFKKATRTAVRDQAQLRGLACTPVRAIIIGMMSRKLAVAE
jgi:hypothetical protein